jgi:glutamate racemase
LAQSADIDTILLACTHYPLLQQKIETYLPDYIKVVPQGDIVAKSLVKYLERHPIMENKLSKSGNKQFFTTSDDTHDFDNLATSFFCEPVRSSYLAIK